MIAAIAIIAEQRVQEAMKRGDFEDLPMKGRPLDLEEDANIPEELRMSYKLLKNGGYLDESAKPGENPPLGLDDMLGRCPEERAKLRQMLKLQVVESRFQGQAGRRARLDEETYHDRVVDRMATRGGSS